MWWENCLVVSVGISVFSELEMSAVWILSRFGNKSLPWGTSAWIWKFNGRESPCGTRNKWFCRYDMDSNYSGAGWNFFSLKFKPVYHTRSKACDTSKNTLMQKFLFSNNEAILATIWWIWWVEKRFSQKPNWVFGIIFWHLCVCFIRFSITFSDNFPSTCRIHIGLYEEYFLVCCVCV